MGLAALAATGCDGIYAGEHPQMNWGPASNSLFNMEILGNWIETAAKGKAGNEGWRFEADNVFYAIVAQPKLCFQRHLRGTYQYSGVRLEMFSGGASWVRVFEVDGDTAQSTLNIGFTGQEQSVFNRISSDPLPECKDIYEPHPIP